MTQFDPLTVLRSESSALIRAEVRMGEQRSRLEQAVRDSVLKMDRSIDEVSEASGLTPDEIRRILETPVPLDDLVALAGAC